MTNTKCTIDCAKYNVKWNIEFWRKWNAISACMLREIKTETYQIQSRATACLPSRSQNMEISKYQKLKAVKKSRTTKKYFGKRY